MVNLEKEFFFFLLDEYHFIVFQELTKDILLIAIRDENVSMIEQQIVGEYVFRKLKKE